MLSLRMSVLLETSCGALVVDLLCDACPGAAHNFLKLCKIKWYNFCPFYNVQRDYIAQCGDQTATGKSGQSVYGYDGPAHPEEPHSRLQGQRPFPVLPG